MVFRERKNNMKNSASSSQIDYSYGIKTIPRSWFVHFNITTVVGITIAWPCFANNFIGWWIFGVLLAVVGLSGIGAYVLPDEEQVWREVWELDAFKGSPEFKE